MKERKNCRSGAFLVSFVAILALGSAPSARGDDDYYDDYEVCCSDCAVYYPDAYADLHGWGHWSWVHDVGTHVWFPHVEASWRPYYQGHWTHTRHGMTWVSHEPWGAIPHHYGHWVYVDRAGWGWVPGREYSPARVTWVVADGYVGWAPRPPDGYRYRSAGSYAYHSAGLDFSFWIFVANDRFYGAPVHRYALPARHSLSLFKAKKIRPVGSRLSVDTVERISKRKIRTVETVRPTKRIEPRGRRDKTPRVDAERTPQHRRIAAANPTPAKKKRNTSPTAAKKSTAGKRRPEGTEADVRKSDRKSKKRSKRDAR